MRVLRAALAAAVLAAPVVAETAVTSTTLDNGLEVVVIEDHRAPVAMHMMWLRAGAADEAPGQSGVAHFLEHLLFKATETRESGEFSRIVAANGGSDNAFTSYDYTAYFQRIAADRLGLMMELEADRMRNLKLTADDVDTERRVILEERSQRTDSDPSALAREQIAAAQYLAHPYGTPVIGWRNEMETLSQEDARAFYDLNYAPNNAVLVVAGDVQPEEVFALAKTHYGPLAPSPGIAPRERAQEPEQRAERRVIFEDPRVGRDYVVRSYLAPERDPGAQEDAAALTYLADLLGGSPFTSVLGRALQFDTQNAVFTGAGYSGLSFDDTTFSIYAAPADGVTLEEIEAQMDAALAQFLEQGPDAEQMDALRMKYRAKAVYDRDSVRSLAMRYGQGLTTSLTLEDIEAWPAILQDVTAEDVMRVAAQVLDRRSAVTGIVRAPKEPS
ncbi:MAG: peptidase M16 [Rhodobacterales bacterium]|nr:MAG: peptidase M16 [Rhodobacterales bacterium]